MQIIARLRHYREYGEEIVVEAESPVRDEPLWPVRADSTFHLPAVGP